MKILIMCVANSIRSQMGEALAKHILGPDHEIQSAGSYPSFVHPGALRAIREIGLDPSEQYSKSVEELPNEFTKNLDLLITLCAEEVCPETATKAKRLHWPMPDPTSGLNPEHSLRIVRDEIAKKLKGLKIEIDSGSFSN